MDTIFKNRENSKTNEPYKFALNLSERLDLKVQINKLSFKIYIFITRGKYKKTV